MSFWKGGIRFCVRGVNPDGILDYVVQNGMECAYAAKPQADTLELELSVKDYKKVRDYAAERHHRVRSTKKYGLPFALLRMRKRAGIFSAIVFLMVMYGLLNSRIWTISVTTDDLSKENEILAIAREYGIKPGAVKSEIDLKTVQLDVVEKYDDIIFFAVNYSGGHAEIVTKSRTEKPIMIDDTVPSEIYAQKDGIIEEIIVKSGRALKEKGDTVVTGDLLVTSLINEETGKRVRSIADITLKTYYKKEFYLPKTVKAKAYTGESEKRYTLTVGNMGFKLYFLEKEPFLCYDKVYKSHRLNLFGKIELPIGITEEIFEEYEPYEAEKIPDDRALTNLLDGEVQNESGGQLLQSSLEKTDMGDFYLCTYRAECLEKIQSV